MSTIDLVSAFEKQTTVLENRATLPTQKRAALESIASFLMQLLRPGEDLFEENLDTVVEAAADRTRGSRQSAFMLLRLLAVPNLLSSNDESARLSRNIVLAAETHLPEICRQLDISTLRQTHQKLAQLSSYHEKAVTHLGPFQTLGEKLDDIIAFRQTAMTIINNGKFKGNCSPR